MQVHTMETSISNELLEGEQLLWSGRPEARGKSIASPGRVFAIVGWIYALIGLLGLIAGFVLNIVFPQQDFNPFIVFWILGGIFLIIGLIFASIGRFMRFPSKNTYYAITDRRVIILRGGRYLRALSYGKRAIAQVQRIERPDGSGDLIFFSNSPSYSSYNSIYSTAYTAGRQGVFTAIPNVRQVEQKLLRMLDEG